MGPEGVYKCPNPIPQHIFCRNPSLAPTFVFMLSSSSGWLGLGAGLDWLGLGFVLGSGWPKGIRGQVSIDSRQIFDRYI